MQDKKQFTASAKSAAIVAQELSVDPDCGLDDSEVSKRRSRYGPNQLRAYAKQHVLVILAQQFKGVIVWLLAFAALSFYFHDISEGVAIVVVLAINAAIGFIAELRAARSMEALLSIATVTARVRRAGQVLSINASDLVPGDIVLLDAGDMVTADVRLVEASNLQCDESVLTGESVPVSKQIEPVAADAAIGEQRSMLFKGTAITQGAGEGIVIATGMATELGHISHLVQTAEAAARADWLARSATAASEGLRLLAMAMKQAKGDDAEPYERLTLVGMVCLRDPLREDVAAAIAAARAAGVRVVMMTGDHAETAAAIAEQAGLAGQGEQLKVMEGSELTDFDPATIDPAQRERILAADVFARVAPATKLKLAQLYQHSGHIVAMTGDGVNDAPALKKADIGIAMGQRGTEVAREAAHMVLQDDSFGSIIAAMHQGRVIFDNIRKFVIYLMSCNVSEVLVVGLAVAVGLPMPLLPLQILFLNLVTDIFPAFALGFGAGDKTAMGQPPRDPNESIIDRRQWLAIAVLGGAITLTTLVAFWLALDWLLLDVGRAVTVSFLTLALAQLWNVFNVRVSGGRFLVNEVTGNPWVWGAIVLCLGLIAAALWLPSLSGVLKLPDPGQGGLLLAVGASFAPLLIGQLFIAVRPAGQRSRFTAVSSRPSRGQGN